MEENKSFWNNNFEIEEFDALEEDIETEVCVIGGGITGISTAYYLAQSGLDVVILEKDKIASKTTGHTTGKISLQHDIFYNYLVENYGFNYAKKYALANKEALENINEIIKKEGIDCDFETKDSIIFSENPKEFSNLQEEARICKRLGIEAEFIRKIELPIIIQGGVRFAGQAQFNPIKYINGLCKSLVDKNVFIYENTKAVEYKKRGKKLEIIAENGDMRFSVLADNVVVATRYPIFDFPGMYFIKNYQELEYAMCVEVTENINNMPMYLSADNPSISFRTALKDDKRYLLVIGNGAKTGEKIGRDEYSVLEEKVRKCFGEYIIKDKWTAEDVISLDKLPYIGRYSKLLPNMYVATGFKKWGMTFSNIAANIISQEILEKKSKYSVLFNPSRVNPIKNGTEMKNMIATTCKSLLKDSNHICTHLGCKTIFNETTGTWDCPCHGSIYDKNGKLIDGPSKKNLKIKK